MEHKGYFLKNTPKEVRALSLLTLGESGGKGKYANKVHFTKLDTEVLKTLHTSFYEAGAKTDTDIYNPECVDKANQKFYASLIDIADAYNDPTQRRIENVIEKLKENGFIMEVEIIGNGMPIHAYIPVIEKPLYEQPRSTRKHIDIHKKQKTIFQSHICRNSPK